MSSHLIGIYVININHIEFGSDLIQYNGIVLPGKSSDYLSSERIEKASRFKSEVDRKRSLCAGFLLNYMVKEWYPDIHTPVAIAFSKVELADGSTEDGKPFLLENPQIHFNLSHSGDYAVCAISDIPVGVDIERCRNMKENVAEHFFTPNEYKDIMSICETEGRQQQFYTYWVLKESFMKATGLGMRLRLNEFEVCLGEKITYRQSVDKKQYFAKIILVQDNYKMAICAAGEWNIESIIL